MLNKGDIAGAPMTMKVPISGATAAGMAIAATVFSQPVSYIGKAMSQPPPSAVQPGPSTPYVDHNLLRAELAAVDARTDAKFAQVMGELKVMSANIASLSGDLKGLKDEIREVKSAASSSKATIIATIIGAAIGIVGLTYAGMSILSGGMSMTASAYQSGMAAAQVAASSAPPKSPAS